MAEYDYNTRREISNRRKQELEKRIGKLSGQDRELAEELAKQGRAVGGQIDRIVNEFYGKEEKTPSQWFLQKGFCLGRVYIRDFWMRLFLKTIKNRIFLL